MASVKLQCFLFFFFYFLFLSITPTGSEVVDSVSKCNDFFLDGKSPNIPGILVNGNIQDQNRYKVICQTLSDQRTFVTLYDIKNKIPVFSASRYTGTDGGERPSTSWKTEKELEDTNNMKNAGERIYKNQADNNDYKNDQNYEKGHLLPSRYGHAENDRKSTFTLTNAVPQIKSFNQGSWCKMEQCVKCVMDQFCVDNNNEIKAFVVIGAKPGNIPLNNKVNIPSMMWSAFCCYSEKHDTWISGAHWGENQEEEKGHCLQPMTLRELHEKMGGEFKVFPETKCPVDTSFRSTENRKRPMPWPLS